MRVFSNVEHILNCTKSSTLLVSIQEKLDGIIYLRTLYNYAFTISVVKSIQIGKKNFWSSTSILSQMYKKK